MAYKPQISFSLVFVAVTVILLADHVTAKIAMENGVVRDPRLEKLLKELLDTTKQVLEKAKKFGSSEMVNQCQQDFATSAENAQKAMDLYTKGISKPEELNQLGTFIVDMETAFGKCDKLFQDNFKPSPFQIFDARLKQIAQNAEKEFAEELKNNN